MKIVCISHGGDVDGLICAAYLRHLKGASSVLATYDDFEDTLKNVDPSVEELYICDLGVREDLYEEILRINKFATVTVVDHHVTSKRVVERLSDSGVTVIYSALDCSSVLLYNYFRNKLSREAARLAAYAAVSDYFDTGPLASSLLSEFDRQFIWHEAMILTHALEHQKNDEFKALLLEELTKFVFPHKIKGAADKALNYLDRTVKLINTLPKKAKRLTRTAYVKSTNEASIGTLASLLVDATGFDVGLVYKKSGEDTVNISIRGKNGIELHLGETTKKLAQRHGGFGGGHRKASGGKIPEENLMSFIEDLESELIGYEVE